MIYANTKTIDLPIVPPTVTAQQKGVFVRNGRAHFFTKSKVRQAENFIAQLLLPHRPSAPRQGPVSLAMEFRFPFRKSERKAVTRLGRDIPHTSRPDLDNLLKGTLDVMTKLGFWNDDSQIAELHLAKSWGAQPHLAIAISDIVPDARRNIFSFFSATH